MMHALVALLAPLAWVPAQLGAAEIDAGPPPIEPRVVDDASGAATDGADGGVADVGGGIPNLTLSAAIEPDIVTFGEPFALVVTIVRERGVHLVMPGTLPDIEGAPRMEAPSASGTMAPIEQRTVVELPGAASASAGGAGVDGGPLGGTGGTGGTAGAASAAGAAGALVRETIRVPYLALDTVDLKTPAFSLTTKDGLRVDVPSLTVKVNVPPESPDAGPAVTPDGQVVLVPAAGAIAYPVNDARPWAALAALMSAVLLYAGVRAVARRRKLRAPVVPLVPPPPPRPAHEVALERLEALLASGLLARGETGVFVERLMDEVLRDYLAARFALPAGTRTTRELVVDLLGVSVPGLDVALVEGLLADADLVKFAKATIAAERAHAMATRVRALVEATRLPDDDVTHRPGGPAPKSDAPNAGRPPRPATDVRGAP